MGSQDCWSWKGVFGLEDGYAGDFGFEKMCLDSWQGRNCWIVVVVFGLESDGVQGES